jgi:hypothetical protein
MTGYSSHLRVFSISTVTVSPPRHPVLTTALHWSVEAMSAALDRVNMIEAASTDKAFAAISEAVRQGAW